MAVCVDLHTHTQYSDGEFSVDDLFVYAKRCGVKILSLTDHDSVEGIPDALRAARKKHITFIPGVELTALYRGGELHILGYGIDWKNKKLLSLCARQKQNRRKRAQEIFVKLHKEGFVIPKNLFAKNSIQTIGRPHIARIILENPLNRALLQKRKWRKFDVSTFIRAYLIPGKRCYVQRKAVSVKEAIRIIHSAQGLAVIAHPLGKKYSLGISLGTDAQWKSHLCALQKKGLDGIEVYASDHSQESMKAVHSFAAQYALLETGGSDFHTLSLPGAPIGAAGTKKRYMYIQLESLSAFFDALKELRHT